MWLDDQDARLPVFVMGAVSLPAQNDFDTYGDALSGFQLLFKKLNPFMSMPKVQMHSLVVVPLFVLS